MDEKQIFTDAFAPAIFEYVIGYNEAHQNSHLKKKLKEAIKTSLHKWSDRYPDIVSKKAYDLAKNYNVDLFQMLWPDRQKCGMTNGKSNLVFEHSTPNEELFKSLIKCTNIEGIKNILNSYSGVCWTTRDEDDILNIKGYKSRREGGWEMCYKDCGIEIIRKI